jgi:hypothetical protein
MLRTFPIFVAMLAMVLTGCKTDSESAMSDMADKQKDLVKILKGVKDKDSAMAAKTKILGLAKDMSEMVAKLDKKKANEAEMTKAAEKYKPELEKTGKEIQGEMERISKIPDAIGPIMEGMMALGGSGMGLNP